MRSVPSLALTAALGLAALGLAPAASAAPAEDGACSGTQGVTVVVQSGSSPEVRCAPGDPKSSGAALADAGFSVQQVQGQDGMVCRIDDAPKISCTKMPSAEKFWAFQVAQPGGTWTFATKGVYQHDPKPGTVIGFRLGDGAAPSIAPPEAAPETGATSDTTTEAAGSDASDPAATDDSGSSALVPTVVGAGLVIVLGGGAWLLARKRRN